MQRRYRRCPILFSALLFAAGAHAQTAGFAAGPGEVDPVGVGDAAPAFTVREVDGTDFDFDPAALENPVLLITFRGGWCPYCNGQLAGLREVLPEIRDGGIDVLFLSADRPEILYSSLQQDTQDSIDGLAYHILSDANLDAARALGIAYRVPDDTLETYESRGRDMGSSSIALHSALPLPAVFIVDTDGDVAFAYSNPDIRVRLPADQVLEAARPFMRSH